MAGLEKPADLSKRIKKIPRVFDDFYWEGGSKLGMILVKNKQKIMEKKIKIVKIKKTDSRKASFALEFKKTKVSTRKFKKDFNISLQPDFEYALNEMDQKTIQQFILASDIIHDFGDQRFNICAPEGSSKEDIEALKILIIKYAWNNLIGSTINYQSEINTFESVLVWMWLQNYKNAKVRLSQIRKIKLNHPTGKKNPFRLFTKFDNKQFAILYDNGPFPTTKLGALNVISPGKFIDGGPSGEGNIKAHIQAFYPKIWWGDSKEFKIDLYNYGFTFFGWQGPKPHYAIIRKNPESKSHNDRSILNIYDKEVTYGGDSVSPYQTGLYYRQNPELNEQIIRKISYKTTGDISILESALQLQNLIGKDSRIDCYASKELKEEESKKITISATGMFCQDRMNWLNGIFNNTISSFEEPTNFLTVIPNEESCLQGFINTNENEFIRSLFEKKKTTKSPSRKLQLAEKAQFKLKGKKPTFKQRGGFNTGNTDLKREFATAINDIDESYDSVIQQIRQFSNNKVSDLESKKQNIVNELNKIKYDILNFYKNVLIPKDFYSYWYLINLSTRLKPITNLLDDGYFPEFIVIYDLKEYDKEFLHEFGVHLPSSVSGLYMITIYDDIYIKKEIKEENKFLEKYLNEFKPTEKIKINKSTKDFFLDINDNLDKLNKLKEYLKSSVIIEFALFLQKYIFDEEKITDSLIFNYISLFYLAKDSHLILNKTLLTALLSEADEILNDIFNTSLKEFSKSIQRDKQISQEILLFTAFTEELYYQDTILFEISEDDHFLQEEGQLSLYHEKNIERILHYYLILLERNTVTTFTRKRLSRTRNQPNYEVKKQTKSYIEQEKNKPISRKTRRYTRPEVSRKTRRYTRPEVSRGTRYTRPEVSRETRRYTRPEVSRETRYTRPVVSRETRYTRPVVSRETRYTQPAGTRQIFSINKENYKPITRYFPLIQTFEPNSENNLIVDPISRSLLQPNKLNLGQLENSLSLNNDNMSSIPYYNEGQGQYININENNQQTNQSVIYASRYNKFQPELSDSTVSIGNPQGYQSMNYHENEGARDMSIVSK
jgi:hypothetical protein